MTCVAFPLSTDGVTPSQKATRVGQAGLALDKSMLAISNHVSVLHVLSIASRRIFSGTEVRLTGQ